MTYCVAMRLKEGLVFASDTRTNAGVDHISTFRKMHIFQCKGERTVVLLTAGNLATSQSIVSKLAERLQDPEKPNLYNSESMFHIAEMVGRQVKETISYNKHGQQNAGVSFACNIILGGQIKGESPRLFHVYPEGNFIEATEDTPYFQIGESKYGKPIIDRIINYNTTLNHAMKCALISFDSTIHSNLSVGMPLDLAIYKEDSFNLKREVIQEGDKYFNRLRRAWGNGLKMLFKDLP